MVHSTGANNPFLKRYLAPNDGLIGENQYGNHWNQPNPDGRSVCVHGFIGKVADGSIATYQTLPWDIQAWHCGGAANSTHISFEICEDGLNDAKYFAKIYKEAVEFSAYLCKQFGLNPIADGVIICHAEGYKRGIASNHGDVLYWFTKFGKTMDMFRQDVNSELHKEDEEMTQEQFNKMMDTYLEQLSKQPPSEWSKAAREWAEANKIVNGYGDGQLKYKTFVTREELLIFLKRLRDLKA